MHTFKSLQYIIIINYCLLTADAIYNYSHIFIAGNDTVVYQHNVKSRAHEQYFMKR